MAQAKTQDSIQKVIKVKKKKKTRGMVLKWYSICLTNIRS
jgi:hypothetical protein